MCSAKGRVRFAPESDAECVHLSVRYGPTVSACWSDRPVTLAPGRARFAIRPAPTGSDCAANTIGMVLVACFAARTGAEPHVTMTSTLSLTNSAAISANRLLLPSAQRYSMATVRPSIQPSSRSRLENAVTHWVATEDEAAPKKPMVGSFPACYAREASGQHVAEPAMTLMKSRRLMPPPRAK
jgi:hypothetical protein